MTSITLDRAAREGDVARSAFVEGVRDVTPMVIGVVPFALAIGASIGASPVAAWPAVAGGPLILAGSAQISMMEMIRSGSPAIVVICSALIINSRLLLYGTSIASWFRTEPLRRRLLVAVFVIDQMFFTCVPRFEQGDLDRDGRFRYYLGAAAFLAGSFVTAQLLAVVVGTQLPEWVGLRIAAPLAIVGLLAKALVDGRAQLVAIVAAAAAVTGVGLPARSALLVAILAGLAVGIASTAVSERSVATS